MNRYTFSVSEFMGGEEGLWFVETPLLFLEVFTTVHVACKLYGLRIMRYQEF